MFLIIPISTVKGANAEGNLPLSWTTGTDDGGTYYRAVYPINNINGIDYFANFVANDTLPMHITIKTNWALYGTVYSGWHFPNEYLFELTPYNTTDFNLTLYIGDVTPETLLFNDDLSFEIEDDPNIEWQIIFKYYTTGLIKDLWDLAMTSSTNLSADYETIFGRGYNLGRAETIERLQNEIDEAYNDGYDDGELFGYDSGYADGQDDQYDIDYAEWYMPRYQKGLADSENGSIALTEFIPGILGTVFAFFFQLASIQFLGISILEILTALFGIAIAIFVIKIFIK